MSKHSKNNNNNKDSDSDREVVDRIDHHGNEYSKPVRNNFNVRDSPTGSDEEREFEAMMIATDQELAAQLTPPQHPTPPFSPIPDTPPPPSFSPIPDTQKQEFVTVPETPPSPYQPASQELPSTPPTPKQEFVTVLETPPSSPPPPPPKPTAGKFKPPRSLKLDKTRCKPTVIVISSDSDKSDDEKRKEPVLKKLRTKASSKAKASAKPDSREPQGSSSKYVRVRVGLRSGIGLIC